MWSRRRSSGPGDRDRGGGHGSCSRAPAGFTHAGVDAARPRRLRRIDLAARATSCETMPVSVAYAVWSGAGTALVAVVGVAFLGERRRRGQGGRRWPRSSRAWCWSTCSARPLTAPAPRTVAGWLLGGGAAPRPAACPAARPWPDRRSVKVACGPSPSTSTSTIWPGRTSPYEQLLGQHVLDLALHGPAQRPRAEHRVETALREQLLGRRWSAPAPCPCPSAASRPPPASCRPCEMISSCVSGGKTIISSTRLRNSGRKCCLSSSRHLRLHPVVRAGRVTGLLRSRG